MKKFSFSQTPNICNLFPRLNKNVCRVFTHWINFFLLNEKLHLNIKAFKDIFKDVVHLEIHLKKCMQLIFLISGHSRLFLAETVVLGESKVSQQLPKPLLKIHLSSLTYY